MTERQFNAMNRQDQVHNLLVHGACIADRKAQKRQVLLFQLGYFYVEVFFDHYSEEVSFIRAFNNLDELQPYLENISLKGVL